MSLLSLSHLLKTLQHHAALERREAVDEEDAVVVVGFVLKAAGGESFRCSLEPLAVYVLRP